MKLLLLALAVSLCSCVNSPFYVDSIHASSEQDRAHDIYTEDVSIGIAPNPYYKLPKRYSK